MGITLLVLFYQPELNCQGLTTKERTPIAAPLDSIPHLEGSAAAIKKDAALRTFPRLFPLPDAMARYHGTKQLESHPAKAFATAHGQRIQRDGKDRGRLVTRAGVERRGFEFPARKAGGGGGHFEFRHSIVQFPAIEAMDGLHGQMRSLRSAARDGGAITASGAFKQVGPAHAS